MRYKFVFLLLLSLGVITGCALQGHLYPVKGPLSLQTPAPVFSASFRLGGLGFGDGIFKAILANGESFRGSGVVKGTKTRLQKAYVTTSPNTPLDLSSAWDAVYGQGYYVAHILGDKSLFQVEITGSRGTALAVAMRGEDAKGVAQDSKGNIYKLIF